MNHAEFDGASPGSWIEDLRAEDAVIVLLQASHPSDDGSISPVRESDDGSLFLIDAKENGHYHTYAVDRRYAMEFAERHVRELRRSHRRNSGGRKP